MTMTADQNGMNETSHIEKIDLGFAKEVASAGDVDLFACYQCQKCTNGCPVAFTMDYGPHEITRQRGITPRRRRCLISTPFSGSGWWPIPLLNLSNFICEERLPEIIAQAGLAS
jgi:hypothetical protein